MATTLVGGSLLGGRDAFEASFGVRGDLVDDHP
jgi:hypothetical protein